MALFYVCELIVQHSPLVYAWMPILHQSQEVATRRGIIIHGDTYSSMGIHME